MGCGLTREAPYVNIVGDRDELEPRKENIYVREEARIEAEIDQRRAAAHLTKQAEKVEPTFAEKLKEKLAEVKAEEERRSCTPLVLQKPAPGFQKDDRGKAPLEMLPFDALVEVARVMHYGAYLAPRPDGSKGYGRDNWRQCEDVNRYDGALLRHFKDRQGGETFDKDSKLCHRAHLACNALFALAIEMAEEAKKGEAA